jgi:acyl-coenzyme A synthetase/AMP-(fatty) acid ligase
MLWISNEGEEKRISFSDMARYSNKAANFFKSLGIRKGDFVMLVLKRSYLFWYCMMALHKIGAVLMPATHMLTVKDLVYRIKTAGIKAIVSIDDESLLDNIAAALGTPEENIVTEESFQKMKSISIDYAVMERAENVVVLEAAFDWNDVGTWTALDRLYADQKDEHGNLAVSSPLLAIDSTGCTVRCDDPDHLVAFVGLRDVVVIQTSDATLIVAKDQEESVRRIVEELKKQDLSRWS